MTNSKVATVSVLPQFFYDANTSRSSASCGCVPWMPRLHREEEMLRVLRGIEST